VNDDAATRAHRRYQLVANYLDARVVDDANAYMLGLFAQLRDAANDFARSVGELNERFGSSSP
jgi:hypothetical protein